MLRDTTDQLNSVSGATRAVAERHSEEPILFASAATILESSSSTPIGWSMRRFLQRRGTMVITSRRVVASASFWSPLTALWTFVFCYCVYGAFRNPDVVNTVLSVVAIGFIIQRRPYARDIAFPDVRRVTFGTVQGSVTKHDIVTLSLDRNSVHLVPAQIVPDSIRERLMSINPATPS